MKGVVYIDMKVGIITFFSAHNYGAVLQAFALKEWIETNIPETEIFFVNYMPEKMKKLYSMSPFYFNVKTSIKRLLTSRRRFLQSKAFNEFISSHFRTTAPVFESNISDILNCFEILFYGSDQIWNNIITGNTDIYWGEGNKNSKIFTYAVSLGTDVINEFQIKHIQEYCPLFKGLSVRETQSRDIINRYTGIKPEIVVDPVYLLEENQWRNISKVRGSLPSKYLLYYSLRKDEKLIKATEDLSKEHNLPIIVIHPTGEIQKIQGQQLYDVGPDEFIGLIEGAEYICTNSFHAVVFSSIFNKRVIHCPNKASKSRVNSLLSLFDKTECNDDIIDFSALSHNKIECMKNYSKEYIRNAFSK